MCITVCIPPFSGKILDTPLTIKYFMCGTLESQNNNFVEFSCTTLRKLEIKKIIFKNQKFT